MTQSKNTKRALLTSMLSVVLCIAMLVGATFAWFTDSVTSGGNKIVAGNLKVDLVHVGGAEDGKDVSLKKNPDHLIFNNNKWEPNFTAMETLRVVNDGNLAFQFRLDAAAIGAVDGPNGEKLADVIDVYVYQGKGIPTPDSFEAIASGSDWRNAGALSSLMADTDGVAHGVLLPKGAEPKAGEPVGSVQMTVALHMRQNAGNEYQSLSLGNLSFFLNAAQYSYEDDSFDDQYDQNAKYPVLNTAELTSKIEAAQPGETVSLASGIFDLPVVSTENVTLLGHGAQNTLLKVPTRKRILNQKETVQTGLVVDKPGLTIRNATLLQNEQMTTNSNYVGVVDIQAGGVTLDGVAISSPRSAVLITGGVHEGETVTIANSTLSSNARAVYIVDDANGIVRIDNTEITSSVYALNVNSASSQKLVLEVTGSKLHGWTSYDNIQSASFTDTEFSQGTSLYNYMRPYANTTFTNCTFDATFKIGAGAAGKTYIINNCIKNDNKVTAENVQDLLLDMIDENGEITGDGKNLKNCTIIVNGTTVTLT